MQTMGAQTYESFLSTGAFQSCPACPQPGINIPDNWGEHEYR